MKQYIGISRDHSGSMSSLRAAAAKDYNENIDAIKNGAKNHDIDTVVSVIKCGLYAPSSPGRYTGTPRYGQAVNEFETINSSVASLKHITASEYRAESGTPLFDSIGELIEQLEKVPDAGDKDVSFLIMAVTDGEENESSKWKYTLGQKIQALQKTDRWTFVFRVPRGYKQNLVRLGIPEGNILEWEQTERGMERSSQVTVAAMNNYYAQAATGVRSTTRFYSDLHNVTQKDVAKKLNEIKGFSVWEVKDTVPIKEFVEKKLKKPMLVGAAFYQLTKPEKIQGHKQICIRHKFSGKVYSGDEARDLLGIPKGGEVKVYPGNHGDYDVFVQSTSTNRKLVPATELLYWPGA